MKIQDLAKKSICILGYGREGKAMVKALEEFAPTCEITIADQNEQLEIAETKHWKQTGTSWLENLEKFDVLIKSPGIPFNAQLEARSSKLTSSTQIFLDSIEGSGALVIGITGSKGKSTTASLLHAILQEAGKHSVLVGNIGEPAIAHIADAKPGTLFVMEMSSYQLADLTKSPHIAVVTSFFPEHLDYHKNEEHYMEAKKNIARYQQEDDTIFFAANSPKASAIAQEGKGRTIPFDLDACPIPIEETHLIGNHNVSNIAAAATVARTLGIGQSTIVKAIKAFHGLPHRLESLGIMKGIEWIDDSISTTPQSTMAALDALGNRVHTLLLGGQDRGYDFTPLAERLMGSAVQTAILFPGSGPRIRAAIEKTQSAITLLDAGSMQEAVALAKEHTQSLEARSSKLEAPMVLLSPASPSYGMFKNFEERGEAFRRCATAL